MLVFLFFFFSQLLSLCEADDTQLSKLPCYKAVQSLTPLRKSALSKFIDSHLMARLFSTY